MSVTFLPFLLKHAGVLMFTQTQHSNTDTYVQEQNTNYKTNEYSLLTVECLGNLEKHKREKAFRCFHTTENVRLYCKSIHLTVFSMTYRKKMPSTHKWHFTI